MTKYGKKAGDNVGEIMHEMKEGGLKSSKERKLQVANKKLR